MENKVSSMSDRFEERFNELDSKLEDTIKGQTICNNHFLSRITDVEVNANFRSNQINRELAVTQYIISIILFCIFLFSLIGDFMYKERIMELQKEVAELQLTIKQLKGTESDGLEK